MANNAIFDAGIFVLDTVSGFDGVIAKVARLVRAQVDDNNPEKMRHAILKLHDRIETLEQKASGKRIRGNAARVLEAAVHTAVNELWAFSEVESLTEACGISLGEVKDAALELEYLELVKCHVNLNSPIGMSRLELVPTAYLRAGGPLLPGVKVTDEALWTLSAVNNLSQQEIAPLVESMVQASRIPLPRLDVVLRAFGDLGWIKGRGPGDPRWGTFMYVEITPAGQRVLRGDDPGL